MLLPNELAVLRFTQNRKNTKSVFAPAQHVIANLSGYAEIGRKDLPLGVLVWLMAAAVCSLRGAWRLHKTYKTYIV